jgi:hypothetical protein
MRAKMTHKNSLSVLYGGLGMSNLQFLIQKIEINFQL